VIQGSDNKASDISITIKTAIRNSFRSTVLPR